MSFFLGLAALASATTAPAPHARAPETVPAGVWSNPAKSVQVAFQPCGTKLCGTVTWASDKAKADARAGGGGDLVGTQLFRNFVATGPGAWSGEVFVPDIGQTLTGTIVRIDARTLRGEGCLFAGFGCKAQTWTRVR